LLFKISKGTRKDFFEIYGQFGQANNKVSPALAKPVFEGTKLIISGHKTHIIQ
jgi:hypothetical protein